MSTEPTSEAAFFSTIRSWGLVRSEQRVFGGVLGGVGSRIGMAPAPARIIFVLIALFTGGLALLAYAAGWALLPDAEGRIIIQDFGRGRPNVGALVVIGLLTLFGFIGLDNWGFRNAWNWWGAAGDFPFNNGFPHVWRLLALLIPLAIIAGIVWVVVWSVRYGKSQDRTAQGYARLPDGSLPDAPPPASPVATEALAVSVVVAESEAPAAEPDEPVTEPAALATPVYSAPVYAAPKPAYTPKPRVPGPGKFGYLAALAMIPIAAAITLYLYSTDQLGVFAGIAGGVIWVAGLGLILIINALRGRKAGFLGFVSFVALVPIGLAIAAAPQIREVYADGDWGWGFVDNGSYHGWTWGNDSGVQWSEPAEPIYTPEPAFDPSAAFLDYDAVAVNGSCYPEPGVVAPEVSGTVRLSAVPTNQSITVTSTDTLLSIPRGTSLQIINGGGTDGLASAHVAWLDRELSCDLSAVDSPAVQLTDADSPVLTVVLDDTMTDGYMGLWIEEN